MKPYLIVSGDFTKTGGMDRANYALACHLAELGVETHLVAHGVDQTLQGKRNVFFHRVPKVLGSYMLAEPLLDRIGRQWAFRLSGRGGRVIVNGGNCHWADVNWVHYVHAAYKLSPAGTLLRRIKARLYLRTCVRREASAICSAKFVVANSRRTRTELIGTLKVPASRISHVYYGIDPTLFHPPTSDDRATARAQLGWPLEQPIVLFIGALGDRRKGFDTMFNAWRCLCKDSSWNAKLAVVGTGAQKETWMKRVATLGISSQVEFLGKRDDVPRILTAADALVSPTRYEAYGLGVHEALCCGLPAFVTRNTGVAEQYTAGLQQFLIPDPEDSSDLCGRLKSWIAHPHAYRSELAALGAQLRQRTWQDMASEIIRLVEDRV